MFARYVDTCAEMACDIFMLDEDEVRSKKQARIDWFSNFLGEVWFSHFLGEDWFSDF